MNEVIQRLMSELKRKTLHNRYFAVRHMQSKANVAGVIVSSEERGSLPEWGLSSSATQALPSAKKALEGFGGKWVIAHSPFTRHRETAGLLFAVLKGRPEPPDVVWPQPMQELNERRFGMFEGKSADNYKLVWERDKADASQSEDGVESVLSVRHRMIGAVMQFEASYSDANIMLISSADPLRILQTAFENRDPREHRSHSPFEPGEVRELKLKP